MFFAAAQVAGQHWQLHELEARAIAVPAVKLSKRLEPYMPALAPMLGPLGIALDALAFGVASYVIVKPRLDYSKLVAANKRGAAIAPVRVEPAGIHGDSATVLDPLRGDAALEGVDAIAGMTVAETDPLLLDRVAESGATLESVDVDELRARVDAVPRVG